MRRSVFPASVVVGVTCALAALTQACGAPSPTGARDGDAATASVASPIIRGTDSDASQDAVVKIIQTVGQGRYTCSGVLIAPNVVLTARHCVSELNDSANGIVCTVDGKNNLGDRFTSTSAAADIAVVAGAAPSSADMANAVVGKKIFRSTDSSICRSDIAIVLLERAVRNAKIAPMRLDGPPVAGETITAVGWGVTEKTESPATRQQRKGIPVVRVGPAAAATQASGAVPPNFFEVGESICEGDSGGPAFATTTGAVIGLVSVGGNDVSDPSAPIASTCEGASARNTYFEISKAKDLILQALDEAGAKPWLEGTSGPPPTASTSGDGGATLVDAGAEPSVATASTGCRASPARTAGSGVGPFVSLGLLGVALARARTRARAQKRRPQRASRRPRGDVFVTSG